MGLLDYMADRETSLVQAGAGLTQALADHAGHLDQGGRTGNHHVHRLALVQLGPRQRALGNDLTWRRSSILAVLGDDQEQSSLVKRRAGSVHVGPHHCGNVDGSAEQVTADRGVGNAQGHQRRNYSRKHCLAKHASTLSRLATSNN